MKKLRRILVAIADLHQGHGGELRRAAGLARATGARVELFHAVTAPLAQPRRIGRRFVDHELTPEESLSVAQKGLERIARSKLLQGCRVDPVAVWDKPAHEAIVRRALATHSDLIINGTRSRGLGQLGTRCESHATSRKGIYSRPAKDRGTTQSTASANG